LILPSKVKSSHFISRSSSDSCKHQTAFTEEVCPTHSPLSAYQIGICVHFGFRSSSPRVWLSFCAHDNEDMVSAVTTSLWPLMLLLVITMPSILSSGSSSDTGGPLSKVARGAKIVAHVAKKVAHGAKEMANKAYGDFRKSYNEHPRRWQVGAGIAGIAGIAGLGGLGYVLMDDGDGAINNNTPYTPPSRVVTQSPDAKNKSVVYWLLAVGVPVAVVIVLGFVGYEMFCKSDDEDEDGDLQLSGKSPSPHASKKDKSAKVSHLCGSI